MKRYETGVLQRLRLGYEKAAAAVAAQYDWSRIGRRFAQVLERVSVDAGRHVGRPATGENAGAL